MLLLGLTITWFLWKEIKTKEGNCPGTGKEEQMENRKTDAETQEVERERENCSELRNVEMGDDTKGMGIEK